MERVPQLKYILWTKLFSDHEIEDTIQEESKNITLEARSQQVTDRLLELQQKHKEISDRV